MASGFPFTTGDPVGKPFVYVASLVAGALVGRVVGWITVIEDTDRTRVGFVGAAGYYVGLFVSAAWHGALNLLPCAMFMMAILSAIFLAGALVALALSARARRR